MNSFDSIAASEADLDAKQQQGDAERESKLVVHCAVGIPPECVEFLWPGRIAIGKQSLLAGEAGLGKSQVTISMAAIVTSGGHWPCKEGQASIGSVLFLCAEDDARDTIIPRLMAAGADLAKVFIVTAVRSDDGKGRRAFNLQSDLEHLEGKIREIGDVRLIVIDPISSYLGPKVDSHVNAAVRGVLEPVGEMASRLRVAIVSVTHPPKGTGMTAINRFIGSIAFVAAARSAFMVMRDANDADRRLVLPVKNNLAPLGKGFGFRLEQHIVGDPGKGIVGSAVAWETSPIDISADAALQAADAQTTGGGSAGGEADEFLRDMLAAGPVLQKEIKTAAEGVGLSWATVRRSKTRLGVHASKAGMDGGWYWNLPKVLGHAEGAHFKDMSTFRIDEHLQSNGKARSSACEHEDGLEIPKFLDRRLS